jgi:hypothetical protein
MARMKRFELMALRFLECHSSKRGFVAAIACGAAPNPLDFLDCNRLPDAQMTVARMG